MLTDLELTEDEESDTLIMRERRKANQGGHLEMVKLEQGIQEVRIMTIRLSKLE